MPQRWEIIKPNLAFLSPVFEPSVAMSDVPLLSRHYIDYVYVPGALLVVGTLIVKKEWALYSIALALTLGAYNFWNFRESTLLDFQLRAIGC